jgi:transposase
MISIRRSEYEQLLSAVSVIAELRKKIRQLEEEIELLKNGRNSSTSSTAPSHDISRSNVHSLRRLSGKTSGGQKGHPGHSLSLSATPDTVIEHMPATCTACGESLETVGVTGITRRQIIDILKPLPVCTEHRSHHKICPSCGAENRGVYPSGVTAPIQYGDRIKSTVSYMSVYQ